MVSLRRVMILAMVVVLSISFLTVFSSEAPAKQKKVRLTLLGAKLGSDAQNFSQALGDIVTKKHPWIDMSVVETLGAVDNNKTMAGMAPKMRKLHVSQSIDPLLVVYTKGVGPFKAIGKQDGWRAMFTLYNTGQHFMTLDKNINNPKKDLIGKKIGLPPKGHGLAKTAEWGLFNCWDLKGKVKTIYMPMGMLKDALLDGTIDVVTSGGMWLSQDEFKGSPFNEAILAARKNLQFIGYTKEAVAHGLSKSRQPYTFGPVNKGARRPGYPPKGGFGLLRAAFTWYVWEDFDQEMAYELVKTAAENAPSFKEYFAAGKAAALESFTANAWGPGRYHPSALKYYKEKGIPMRGKF
ncbi:TAXI family TRAP transporter solute-binding subunit [Thermodesulfobacteriota bacterium]